jgi:Tfp pilus assembly protein PilV
MCRPRVLKNFPASADTQRSMPRPSRSLTRSESGFALMEVIASMAVLIIVVLGVLASLDAVSGTAGANKARTVAATLAEEDQERLRGMSITDLDGYSATRPIDVANVRYTVESTAEWVRDASGETVSCTSQTGQTSYLRIRSTVTSPATGTRVRPVVLSSIVAPPAGTGTNGTLAVSVRNAAGQIPATSVPVTISGPTSGSKGTNEQGCAVFALVPAGTYTVSVTSGYVDKSGSAPSKTVDVSSGNLNTTSLEADQAASVNVRVETLLPGQTARTADDSTSILAANTGIQPSGYRLFTPVAPAASAATFALTTLFPFSDGYTIYSGECMGEDPSRYVPTYFQTHQGIVTVAPGQHAGDIAVLEPAINVVVKRGTTAYNASTSSHRNWYVRLYRVTADCEKEYTDFKPLATGGKLTNPGHPFGDYVLCVSDGSRRAYHGTTASPLRNIDPAGTATIPLTIPTSGSSGNCAATAP